MSHNSRLQMLVQLQVMKRKRRITSMLSGLFVKTNSWRKVTLKRSDSCPGKEEGKGSSTHAEIPQPIRQKSLLDRYASLQQSSGVPHEERGVAEHHPSDNLHIRHGEANRGDNKEMKKHGNKNPLLFFHNSLRRCPQR